LAKNGEEMLDASSNAASGPKLKPPSGAMVLAEARALIEWNACLMMTPVLMTAPRGDGKKEKQKKAKREQEKEGVRGKISVGK